MARLFDTLRLSVDELSSKMSVDDLNELYSEILRLLTPSVVVNLPDAFQGITTTEKAAIWFEQMLSESRFFVVKKQNNKQGIGFLFIYTDKRDAHIGYLLGESFWRLGYARELIAGLIEWSRREAIWSRLIGGVAKENIASSKLLTNMGFQEELASDGTTRFYIYNVNLSITDTVSI